MIHCHIIYYHRLFRGEFLLPDLSTSEQRWISIGRHSFSCRIRRLPVSIARRNGIDSLRRLGASGYLQPISTPPVQPLRLLHPASLRCRDNNSAGRVGHSHVQPRGEPTTTDHQPVQLSRLSETCRFFYSKSTPLTKPSNTKKFNLVDEHEKQ